MTVREMFGNERWVTVDENCRTPYIRGEFYTDRTIKQAEITICGLGSFELYINGKRIGKDMFVPANSNYHAFDQQFCFAQFGERLSHRIYCQRYDITEEMEQNNCIGVALAPGWYPIYG